MPGVRQRQGNRERLLEAAIQCLAEKGYARTTARDLVAASGTNLASIGYHFGSKEALLNAAVSEAFQRWLMPLVELASRPGPATPLERLGMGLRECLGSLEANREIVVAFFEALAQVERAPGLRQRMADSYAEFRQTIAATVRGAFGEAGEEAGVNSEAVASVIMAVFDGLLLQWSLDPDRVPDADELLRSTSIAALLAARPA